MVLCLLLWSSWSGGPCVRTDARAPQQTSFVASRCTLENQRCAAPAAFEPSDRPTPHSSAPPPPPPPATTMTCCFFLVPPHLTLRCRLHTSELKVAVGGNRTALSVGQPKRSTTAEHTRLDLVLRSPGADRSGAQPPGLLFGALGSGCNHIVPSGAPPQPARTGSRVRSGGGDWRARGGGRRRGPVRSRTGGLSGRRCGSAQSSCYGYVFVEVERVELHTTTSRREADRVEQEA